MLTAVTPLAQELRADKKRREAAESGAVAARCRHGDERPADEAAEDGKERRLHPGHGDDDVGALDLLEAREQSQDPRHADVRNERRGDAQVLERAARLLGHEPCRSSRPSRCETEPSTRGIGLPTDRMQRGRARVVVGAARQGTRRELLPALRRQVA